MSENQTAGRLGRMDEARPSPLSEEHCPGAFDSP